MRMKNILLALLLLCSQQVAAEKIRVACVGNSVTYGMGISNREQYAYPSQLQELLGDNYEVGNFGHSGATLLRKGHKPYHKLPEFRNALDFKADRVVIHLGLNDTDPRNWPQHGDDFIADYRALIDSFKVANPEAKIWICRMTPIFPQHHRFQSGTRDWHALIQKRIEQIAATAGVGLIDLYEPLHKRPDLFPDALHPNAEGATILAKTIYGALTGNYGGLSVPQTYGNGMVLQRERPISFHGKANAGEKVTVKFKGKKRSAQADANGAWEVTFPTEKAGGPYLLSFKAGSGSLTFDNVWVGEVWLCSGQSNMEMMLHECLEADKYITAADSLPRLHLFKMPAICSTANFEWEDAALDATNKLGYLKPGTWTRSNAEAAKNFSAIAFHFGRLLADSLDCHVGLICNAVGGSTTESWIDRTTLEYEYPAILHNWKQNDHTQQWARERAALNTKRSGNALQRHPYEPCYLFEGGILPLERYDIRGVIWYQGESNAHNIELHEMLFRHLENSWRKYWNNPELPFHFVQLSSISGRDSWPHFRDSQRRLAEALPHTWMAVCSDLGDAYNVHPRQKREVGERLAASALHHTYGMHHVVPEGPTYRQAIRKGSKLYVFFDHSEGMQAADGKEIVGFEVAGADGLYHKATATIKNGKVILESKKVKQPCAVRYGWQAFTTANLVNGKGFPASTFREENIGVSK